MYNDLHFGRTGSFVSGDDMITIEYGNDSRGKTVYRVGWYHNKKWQYAYYRTSRAAWTTCKLIMETIKN